MGRFQQSAGGASRTDSAASGSELTATLEFCPWFVLIVLAFPSPPVPPDPVGRQCPGVPADRAQQACPDASGHLDLRTCPGAAAHWVAAEDLPGAAATHRVRACLSAGNHQGGRARPDTAAHRVGPAYPDTESCLDTAA